MNQELKQVLPGIQFNVSLKNHTSFRIGGKAKYFFVARTNKQFINAIKLARKHNLLFFILGGGTKLLVSDKTFNGLVIKVQNSGFKVNDFKIFAESGLSTAKLTEIALENNLTGLEWLKGIPGTVGGAIRGNAGAFDGSMKNVISFVEAFDKKEEKLKIFKNKDCKFAYRTSIFKRIPELIILSCEIKLKKGNKSEIEKTMSQYLEYRKKNQPLNFASCGSIFKNFDFNKPSTTFRSEKGKVVLGKIENKLFEKFPEFKKFKKTKIIPAGFLIEKAGLKGKSIGDAKVSEKHSNFIVNLGNAKAEDVKKLIDLIKNKIKNKFKIELEEEVQYFNF